MKVAKAVVAAVGSVASVLTAALADNLLGADEVTSVSAALGVAVVTVYEVWRTPNQA